MLIKILKFFANKLYNLIHLHLKPTQKSLDKYIIENKNISIIQVIKHVFHYILYIGKYLRIFSFYRIWRLILNSVLLTNISISLFIMYSVSDFNFILSPTFLENNIYIEYIKININSLLINYVNPFLLKTVSLIESITSVESIVQPTAEANIELNSFLPEDQGEQSNEIKPNSTIKY